MYLYQSLDALVRSSELYFRQVPIPEEFEEIACDLEFLSPNGHTVSQYVLWLARTCQVETMSILQHTKITNMLQLCLGKGLKIKKRESMVFA